MTELKTLKDLEKDFKFNNSEDYINSKKLKAEAVKWAMNKYKIHIHPEGICYTMGLIEFLEFFNLTEEDLKDDTVATGDELK